MPFYRDRVYPSLVSWLGNPKPIDEIRQRLLPLATGNVLEIGVGPGVNFSLYRPDRVETIYALEPNPGMLRRAEQRAKQSTLNIQFLGLPSERIPLADASVDTVVSTFTLCTIPAVVDAIRGISRVLKPNGKFIFFEHGRSSDPHVRKWQTRCEPLFRWALEGCHITRDIPSLLRDGGFRIEQIEQGYLACFPKSGSFCWWGVAVPAFGQDWANAALPPHARPKGQQALDRFACRQLNGNLCATPREAPRCDPSTHRRCSPFSQAA